MEHTYINTAINTFIFFAVICFGLFLFQAIRYKHVSGGHLEKILSMFMSLVMCFGCSYLAWNLVYFKEYEEGKTIEYYKPQIELIELDKEKIVYKIEGLPREFTEIKYLDSNRIYIELEYYKETTNKKIICK